MKMRWSLVAVLVVGAVLAAEDKKEKDDVGTVIGIDLGTTYSW